jgi:hypothetical protein
MADLLNSNETSMIQAVIQVFSITLEAFFRRPKPFAKDKIDQIAEWLTDSADGFALRPDQVRVRHTDIVFDYELSASFYGGNATFHRDAEKSALSARGARTRQDADLLRGAAERFARFAASEEKLPLVFSANAHASLPSVAAREQFLEGLRPDPRVISPGALGYVQLVEWPDAIRIAIEPSFNAPQSLFFSWQTNLAASEDWQSTFEILVGLIEKATAVYGIEFLPLVEA